MKDQEQRLALITPGDYARVIEHNFVFYSKWYERLRRAAESLQPGLECVLFNAQHAFTLQYPLMLAPLRIEEDESMALRKVRVVSAYIDILIHQRIWNWHAIDYSTMQYAMFTVMRDIRGKSAQEVADLLGDRLAAEPETFAYNDHFSLNGGNRRQIHLLLARITAFVEVGSGHDQRFTDYIRRSGRNGYEVAPSGPITLSDIRMSSSTRVSFATIATAWAISCCFQRVSTRATATYHTRRNTRTT